MAEAAEKQAYWSKLQALFSAVAIAGLIATIIYTHATLRLTQRNARVELRAYVLVADFRILKFNELPEYYVEIKNFGQTPAQKVSIATICDMTDFPLKKELVVVRTGIKSAAVLAPGHPLTSRGHFSREITAPEKTAVFSGQKAIFLHGEIDYVDVFEEPHKTTFRFMIGGPHGVDSEGHMTVCDDGNNAT